MSTIKNTPKTEEKKTRPVSERFYIRTEKGVRLLTDKDEAADKQVYVILPRNPESKVVGVEVANTCKVTGHKFICIMPERKQEDGSWEAKLDVHPVIFRRQLLNLEKRQTQVQVLKDRHGDAVAALFKGGK